MIISCNNCGVENAANYDTLHIKRKSNYRPFEKPEKILYVKCTGDGCLADITMDFGDSMTECIMSNKYNDIVEYDKANSYSILYADNIVFGAFLLFVLIMICPIAIPAILIIKICLESSSKDTVQYE